MSQPQNTAERSKRNPSTSHHQPPAYSTEPNSQSSQNQHALQPQFYANQPPGNYVVPNQQPGYYVVPNQLGNQPQYLPAGSSVIQPQNGYAAPYQQIPQVQSGDYRQIGAHATPYMYVVNPNVVTNVSEIHDYLIWSIINMFVGGIILGLIPLMFSISCREAKTKNDGLGARSKSKGALISNIIVSLIGIGVWITVIVLLTRSPYYYG